MLLSILLIAGLATALLVPSPVTEAQTSPDQTWINTDSVIRKGDVIKGNVNVTNGDLTIHGEVQGDVVVVSGNVEMDGRVTGNVTTLMGGAIRLNAGAHVGKNVLANGDIVLGPGTQVVGDVSAVGGKVTRDPKASVGGAITAPELSLSGLANQVVVATAAPTKPEQAAPDEPMAPRLTALQRLLSLFAQGMIGLVVLALGGLLVALVPKRVRLAAATLEAEPGPSIIVGFIAAVLLFPVVGLVGFLLVVSVVGLLFVPVLALAVGVLMLGGLATIGTALGGWAFVSGHRAPGTGGSTLVFQAVAGMAVVLATAIIPSGLRPGFVSGVMMVLLYFTTCAGLGAVILSRLGTLAPPRGAPSHFRSPFGGYSATSVPVAGFADGQGGAPAQPASHSSASTPQAADQGQARPAP